MNVDLKILLNNWGNLVRKLNKIEDEIDNIAINNKENLDETYAGVNICYPSADTIGAHITLMD